MREILTVKSKSDSFERGFIPLTNWSVGMNRRSTRPTVFRRNVCVNYNVTLVDQLLGQVEDSRVEWSTDVTKNGRYE